MQGSMLFDFDSMFPEAINQLSQWLEIEGLKILES